MAELSGFLPLGEGFKSVYVEFRAWQHHERYEAARAALMEAMRRMGASVSPIVVLGTAGRASESVEIVRNWRAGEQLREEIEGGAQSGSYSVLNGPVWSHWSPSTGAATGRTRPQVVNKDVQHACDGGHGQRLSLMFDPDRLRRLVLLEVVGTGEHLGRRTILTEGTPQISTPAALGPPTGLGAFGACAERYHIAIDAERGLVLSVQAFHDGRVFRSITATTVAFDEPLSPDLFEFRPPPAIA